ncbi:hypothetical protein DAI22_01g490400 [Oryza sativa Japonica Group]|nr:hypothetical protein DAI22_01g490400 [Oryza sativa Japonica Group]
MQKRLVGLMRWGESIKSSRAFYGLQFDTTCMLIDQCCQLAAYVHTTVRIYCMYFCSCSYILYVLRGRAL